MAYPESALVGQQPWLRSFDGAAKLRFESVASVEKHGYLKYSPPEGPHLKHILQIVPLLFVAASGSAGAQSSDAIPWLEMLNACEALMTEQTERGFDGFAATHPLLNVEGLPERAIRHPDAPIVSSAISNSFEWFLCIVAADPPVEVRGAGVLIDALTGTLQRQIDHSDDHGVVFNDAQTFAPVRVSCHDDGRSTVAFAFAADAGDLRIAVTNRLPAGTQSPCPN